MQEPSLLAGGVATGNSVKLQLPPRLSVTVTIPLGAYGPLVAVAPTRTTSDCSHPVQSHCKTTSPRSCKALQPEC